MNPSPSVDVGHLLDQGHWTAYQIRLVALVALTIVFDGIDNQLLGIVIPTFMREGACLAATLPPSCRWATSG